MIEAAQAITQNDLPPTQRVYGVLDEDSPNKNAWAFGGDFFCRRRL